MSWTKRLSKWLVLGGVVASVGIAGSGCLARPVGKQPPTTKVNVTSTISQQQVDKLDLLFMIDNSASMGDKQTILAEAVPNLVEGLLKPKCVDPNGKQQGNAVADPTGSKDQNFGCPGGTEPEFKPVTDMHVGVITSSLGSFGGDVCPEEGRFNDKAHLLNIKADGGDIPLAKPSNFLAWFPNSKENDDPKRHPPPATPTRTIAELNTAFGDLVVGTGQKGCGLEAQLESIYRFLIQPDPWVKIGIDNFKQADLGEAIDVELLQQRADFLRADSLVAIVALTDEDDSSADPLAVSGQGWAFMARDFPGSNVYRGDKSSGTTAPRPTTVCAKDPGSPDCTSCGFQSLCNAADAACQKIKNDPNCKEPGSPPIAGAGPDGYNGFYAPTADNLNVRFHRMKERFGIDPQYPIKRYVDGLSKLKVPDRKAEHPTTVGDNGRRNISGYQSTAKCTNPLFAKTLPKASGDELCNLPRSTRSPDLIFFAVVGGVPNDLLHFKPGDPDASRVLPADFVKILGQDPAKFDFTGIDPHMVQSVSPRSNIAEGPSTVRGDNGKDPFHGREWETNAADLQYACTFALPKMRPCDATDTSCDCAIAQTNPPLCGAKLGEQTRAKAYPTIREFMVVRALGEQGIIASLCPIQLTNKDADDYGYKPAVAAIIDRLKNALTTQCLPQQLTRDTSDNKVPCRVLAQLAEEADSCSKFGLTEPPKEILDVFKEEQRLESGVTSGPGALDLSRLPVCDVTQVAVKKGEDCHADTNIVWCYVENDAASGKNPAGRCPQALLFSTGTGVLQRARFSLQCIQQFAAGSAAGDQTQP